MAGSNGSSHACNARLEQFPTRSQTIAGLFRLCLARLTKSSSLVRRRLDLPGHNARWERLRYRADPLLQHAWLRVRRRRGRNLKVAATGQTGWKLGVNDESHGLQGSAAMSTG